MDWLCISPIVVVVILFALFTYTLTHINVSRTGAGQTTPNGATFWLEQWVWGEGARYPQSPRLALPLAQREHETKYLNRGD